MLYLNGDICKVTNWLVKDAYFWTSSYSTTNFRTFNVGSRGVLGTLIQANSSRGILPAIILSSDITLSGSGSLNDPYVIV